MKIYNYKVRIQIKPGYFERESTYNKNEYNIVYDNSDYFVIDDSMLQTLKFKESDTGSMHSLNTPSITSFINDHYWGTTIWYSIYSDKPVEKSLITRQVRKYINDKFAAIVKVDLSFLQDKPDNK